MNTSERNSTPDFAVLLQTLRALPQARHFTAQQAAGWLTQMQAREAEGANGGLPFVGHVRRLGGFGASEIGLLVGERRGRYSPFGTAREVVAGKLLQRLPDPGNSHTRRGLLMEPLIREEFLQQSGAVRRDDITRRIAGHTAARWPWMLATPDDLVELDGVLGVVDYKAPAEPLTDLSLSHTCQLHQIGLLAADLGYSIGFRAIVAWNHRQGTPEVLVCERDPALEQELIAAGEHYWNRYVLTGTLPDWPARETPALALADLPVAAKLEIEALAERYWRLDLLAREAKALTDAARARLQDCCRVHRLTDAVACGPVQIKPRATWSLEAVEARLDAQERAAFLRLAWDPRALVDLVRALGGDPDAACASGDPTLDLDAAATWLMAQKGVPETELRATEYQPSVSRRKADQPVLEPVRAAARAATHDFGAVAAPGRASAPPPGAPAPGG